jgi:hypothetical protein
MKALSIQQPWAWLIANGHKEIKNRDWKFMPTFRGRFLIHTGMLPDKEALDDMELIQEQTGFLPPSNVFEFGGIIGVAEIVDCVREHPSSWFFGPIGFVLRNATPLPFIPYRGQLGFFEVPDSYGRAAWCTDHCSVLAHLTSTAAYQKADAACAPTGLCGLDRTADDYRPAERAAISRRPSDCLSAANCPDIERSHRMTDKPQYAATLLPGNEVRFLSLSRTAKVKPEYRPMG